MNSFSPDRKCNGALNIGYVYVYARCLSYLQRLLVLLPELPQVPVSVLGQGPGPGIFCIALAFHDLYPKGGNTYLSLKLIKFK